MKKPQKTHKNEKFKNILLYIIIPVASFIAFTLIWNVLLSFKETRELTLTLAVFKQRSLYTYSAITTLIIFLVSLGISIYYDSFGRSKILNKAEDADSDIYGNSRWLYQDEIRKSFGYYDFKKLPETNVSGYVVQSIIDKKVLRLSMVEEQHALMTGVSGDGKSLRYIGTCIQANANSKTKATLIINDAKGELYGQHSQFLKERGYDVKLINLRKPRQSMRFNPLSLIWDLWMGSLKLETQSQLSPSELNELYGQYLSQESTSETEPLSKDDFYKNWQREQLLKANDMKDRAEVLIQELSKIIVPDTTGDNKQWSDGAQGICAAVIYAMLEDGCNPELNFTKDLFTISQISNIVNRQQSELINFLKYRNKISRVFDYAGTVIDNASEKTVSSFLSTFSSSLKSYLEGGIEYILSSTDIDLKTLVTKPTAVFILVPDEYTSRHVVATMAITQIYNELIFQSSEYPNNKLPRPVYMMIDEFGNLPKLAGLPVWITISKSRGIYFNLIVQALSQITGKYGEWDAKTIVQNCHLQMIMGSNESDTVKHFLDKFGTRTIYNRTANFDQKSDIEYHGSSSLAKVELLSADQLQKIPPGLVYWKLLRMNPAKTNLEIIFNMTDFIKLGSINDKALPYFNYNSADYFYDIQERNLYLESTVRDRSSARDYQDNTASVVKVDASEIKENDEDVSTESIESYNKRMEAIKLQSLKEEEKEKMKEEGTNDKEDGNNSNLHQKLFTV